MGRSVLQLNIAYKLIPRNAPGNGHLNVHGKVSVTVKHCLRTHTQKHTGERAFKYMGRSVLQLNIAYKLIPRNALGNGPLNTWEGQLDGNPNSNNNRK